VQGIVAPAQRGQDTIDQGVILLGREGDNGILPAGKRKSTSKFLALRKRPIPSRKSSSKREELLFFLIFLTRMCILTSVRSQRRRVLHGHLGL
jgi:hypothetical protein